jgi:hypothetical protein
MRKVRNTYKILVGKPEDRERGHLNILFIDGNITLN